MRCSLGRLGSENRRGFLKVAADADGGSITACVCAGALQGPPFREPTTIYRGAQRRVAGEAMAVTLRCDKGLNDHEKQEIERLWARHKKHVVEEA